MRQFITCGLVLAVQLLFSQAPPISWQKCLGGSAYEGAESLQQTSDGGFIMAGFASSNDGDVSGWHEGYWMNFDDFGPWVDVWVVKLNSSGAISWQKCLGGSQYDVGYAIQQTTDGGYIVAGLTASNNNGDVSGWHGNFPYNYPDAWVVKLNSSGSITWQKCLGGYDDDRAYSVQQTSDGGYIVGGYTHSNDGDVSGNHGNDDYWVVKLDASGTISWQKCLGGTGYEKCESIQQTTDGGYILSGTTTSNNGDVTGNHGLSDFWVVKLNSSGTLTWQKCLGGSSYDYNGAIQQTFEGGYIVCGSTYSNDGDVNGNHGGNDFWVVKLDASGLPTWQNCLGSSGNEEAFDVQQTLEGGYVVAGWTNWNDGDVSGWHEGYYEDAGGNSPDEWIVNLTSSGSLAWQKCLGGFHNDQAFSVQQTSDGGYIVGGLTFSNEADVSGNHGMDDAWVVKLSNFSCPTLNATAQVTNPTCFESTNGSINVTAPNNGIPPYTYLWSTGATTQDISGLAGGMYSLAITDASSCVSNFNYWVNAPDELFLDLVISEITCFGEENGSIAAVPVGGVLPYTYLWSNGATSSVISNLPAGSYTLTLTDANGCSGSAPAALIEPTALTTEIDYQDVSCFGASNGMATAIASGGGWLYYYLWSNGSDDYTITDLSPGIYTVTVTDNYGCTTTNSVNIAEPPLLSLTASSQNVSCFGSMNGSATVTPEGGSPGYSFLWSNGFTTSTISNLNPGTYAVTVTDAQTCTITTFVTITEPSAMVLNVTGYDGLCFGDMNGWAHAVVSGGVAGYTYLWSNGATSDSIVNLPAGIYGLTITDATACTISTEYEVSSPELLQLTVITTNVTTPGGSDGTASTEVNGGTPIYTYLWSTGETTSSIFNLSSGNYSVTVTDDHGCSQADFFTIADPDCGISVQVNTTLISCAGGSNGSATAEYTGGNGNATFLWSNGETGQTITDLYAGTYFLTVSENGCTVFGIATLDDPLSIDAQIISTPTSCNDNTGSAFIIASGGTGLLTYLWSNGESASFIENLYQGIYSVTVTDANACTSVQSEEIVAIDTEVPVIVQTNDTLFVNAVGGIDDYSTLQDDFSDACGGYTFTVLNLENLSCGDLFPDTIDIMVTDLAGNDTIYQVTITLIDTIQPSIVSCPTNIEQGTCQGIVIYDLPLVTDNCQLDTFYQTTGLPSGVEYPIGSTLNSWLAVDHSGNVATCSFVVTISEGIVLSANVHPISCRDQNDASIALDTSNILPPFSVLWSNGDTTAVLQDLPEGEYSVILTDKNGCQAMDTFQIINPDLLSFPNSNVHPISCRNQDDASITIDTSNILPPFTILWSTGDSTPVLQDLGEGEYSVILTNMNGCQAMDTFQIINPEFMNVDVLEIHDVTSPDSANGSIVINVSGGTPPYMFQWELNDSIISTEQNPKNLAHGTYQLIITDAHSCSYVGVEAIVGIITSINNPVAPLISIFPNPAKEKINVVFVPRATQAIPWMIFDLLGRRIREGIGEPGDFLSINTSLLEHGAYLVCFPGTNYPSLIFVVEN